MTTPSSVRPTRTGIAARLALTVTVVAAVVLAAVPAGPAGADGQIVELHDPGIVLRPVADGRLRSCATALTVTGVARSDHAGAGYELVQAPAGFSMVVFSVHVERVAPLPDQTINEARCDTTAALVTGNVEVPMPDGSLALSGDRIFTFALAKSQSSVFLQLDTAGFTQRFDLLAGHRDGPAPLALYRDPQRPDVLINPPATATASAPISMASQNMTATFTAGIVRAQLTEFQPGASSGVAPANQAFLRVWLGYESGAASNGDRIEDLGEIPADHLHLVLSDGRTVTATHTGPDDDRYAFPGIYYFTVPDTLTAATLRLDPVTVAAVDVAGGVVHADVGRPDGPTTIGGLSLPIALPDMSATVIGGAQPVAPTPAAAQTAPARHHHRFPWLLLGVITGILILAGAGLFGARRRQRRAPDPAAPAGDGSVAWIVNEIHWPALLARLPAFTLTGPGAPGALRAAAERVIDSGGTVIADPPTAAGPLTDLPVRAARSSEGALSDAHAAIVETRRDPLPHNGDRTVRTSPAVLVAVDTIPDHHHQTAAALSQDPDAPLNVISAVAWEGSASLTIDPAGTIIAAEHHPDLVGRHVPLAPIPAATDPLPPISCAAAGPLSAPAGTGPEPAAVPAANRGPAAIGTRPSGVALRTFGTVALHAAGRELTSGLRAKALELAVFLAWHRDGATLDAIIDALFPDADPKRGADQFHTVAANLRTVIRSATSTNSAVIERVAKRYQIQPDLFDIDLWRFTDQINTPAGAGVLSLYTGDFAADIDATWVLGPRQTLRRTALDATSRLSTAAPTPADAVRIAEHAITIDPYDEAGYQLVISHQIAAEDTAAANRTYALLHARLAELDLTPSPAVINLVQR